MIKDWIYKNKELTEIPEGYIGFVYLITNNVNGYIYVGKKVFNFNRRKALTKKEKLLNENKRKRFKTITTDSKWKEYYGSSATLSADIALYGKENFTREILELCYTKTELTYKEVWWQFKLNVLECNSYNGNILSRFFKKKKD